ncbi:MAG: hypothetical protein OK439_05075 [Thaumarchaeota archaeon]|nr:hypothetical protein [Nitrososphaerota archaeon]
MQRSDFASQTLSNIWQVLSDSGLLLVALGFTALVMSNLITLYMGQNIVLLALNSDYMGVLLSWTVFDSWGTVFGLLGVVILFAPVLFGMARSRRRSLSIFFVSASIISGVISTVVWNYFYNLEAMIPYGASSIAVSAQAIIFALSAIGLFSFRFKKESSSREVYWRNSLTIIYITLIGTTLWFILILEPIFVPTEDYNWRAHEFGFLLGLTSTLVYSFIEHIRSRELSWF